MLILLLESTDQQQLPCIRIYKDVCFINVKHRLRYEDASHMCMVQIIISKL